MLDEVEKQLLQQFEEQGRRTVLVHEAVLGDVLTRVSMQRNRHGEPVFRYWFGESRVDRRTFQTLTCTETFFSSSLAGACASCSASISVATAARSASISSSSRLFCSGLKRSD